MKFAFIPAKYKDKVVLPQELIDSLPNSVALFTTIQYTDSLQAMKEQLEKSGRNVVIDKTPHSIQEGQLLGCGIKNHKEGRPGEPETAVEDFDAFLFVGDGAFHPLTLLVRNEQKVICYDPFTDRRTELTRKDVDYALKKEKAGYVKFLSSKEIGVLISTKPGQNRLHLSQSLKKEFPDKNFYFMMFDQLDFTQLENFPFVECWVNTACPRIMIDDIRKFNKPIINIERLLELLKPNTIIPPR